MSIKRAYSLLEVKSYDEEKREITGVATTPSTDSYGDIVESEGAVFDLPIPLLWQHSHDKPIGHVTAARVKGDRIEVTAKLARVDEAGPLRDRLDEAWQSIKHGLVRGLSIGFRALEWDPIETGIKFTKWAWLELSAVTIPANADASIETVRAASGAPPAQQPRVRGGAVSLSIPTTDEVEEMTVSEQIKALSAKRESNRARMTTLAEKAAEEGRTMDDAEGEEYDDLASEIKTIEKDLSRLSQLQDVARSSAEPVAGKTRSEGSASRQGVRVSVPDEKTEPGINFARLARVRALARIDDRYDNARHAAKSLYGENSKIYGHLKQRANVPAASTGDDDWAGFLVGEETDVYADFIEFLRPQTILGKFGTDGIPALRSVPFNVPLIGVTSGATAYWVGEGDAKPLTSFEGERNALQPYTVAALAAATKQLLRRSSPSADRLIRDALADAVIERMDVSFIDPANGGGQAAPASITNGIDPIGTTGCDADAIRCDISAMVTAISKARNPFSSGVWIMSSQMAVALWQMRNPLGQREFPDLGLNGGIFEGFPVIVSDYLGDEQYMATGHVALVNASDIYIGDEDNLDVTMSEDASLEMVDNPTGSSTDPTPAQLVNMFQTNSVAFRVEREIGWMRRRPGAVALLSGANWGCCDEEDSGDPGQ